MLSSIAGASNAANAGLKYGSSCATSALFSVSIGKAEGSIIEAEGSVCGADGSACAATATSVAASDFFTDGSSSVFGILAKASYSEGIALS